MTQHQEYHPEGGGGWGTTQQYKKKSRMNPTSPTQGAIIPTESMRIAKIATNKTAGKTYGGITQERHPRTVHANDE